MTLDEDSLRLLRVRRRRRAAAATLACAAAVAAVTLGPTVAGSVGSHPSRTRQPAAGPVNPHAAHATSEVVTLRNINKTQIITWFEGSRWCTATTQVHAHETCLGPVEPSHQGFSYILPPRSSAVTVDDEHVVAGIAPPGSSRVLVHLNEGRFFDALITTGAGFAAPVWSALLFDDADGRVDYYTAFDGKGQEIARLKA